MYIKLNNGVPENYSIGQLRKDNVNTSFPRHLTSEILSEHDVYAVTYEQMPEAASTKKLKQNEAPTLVDGSWVIGWTISDKTDDELAADSAIQAQSVRSMRDVKIAETDWTASTDVTMTAEMTTYRQALRDVPAQAGFPNTITWPEAP